MRRLACIAAGVALLIAAQAAQAAFPGANGKIVYASNSPNEFEASAIASVNPDGTGRTLLTGYEFAGSEGISWSPDGAKVAFDDACCTIYTMNPDGSGRTEIDFSGWDDGNPAWSPDGTKVVFHTNRDSNGGTFDLYTMNADGTGQVRLTNDPGSALYPAWSPDGKKIAFFSGRGPTGIWVMDSDGGNPAFLAAGVSPNWSPDGSKIAFTDGAGSSSEIFVMDANGSNRTQITNDSVVDRDPAWSPDGQKIVFAHGPVIYTMNANGSAMAQVVTQSFGEESQSAPDWQPIPINGYARPKGATPTRISLVPAYEPCGTPNRDHGAPLAVGSCSPPVQTSGELTVGTLDANGNPAKSVGYAAIRVKVGNPSTPADEADLRLQVRITDVRNKTDFSDYAGQLQARPLVRITDKDSTPSPGGPGAATTIDTQFPFTVPCASTSDTTIGSTCSTVTSADAVLPGSIKEERRANWQLQRFDLYDGSNTLFATEGIFVP